MAEIVRLQVEPANSRTIAPFGRLIGAATGGAGSSTRFYGDAIELWHIAGFQSDDDTCLSVARVRPRARRVIWMERHFKHTQAFVPLDGQSFLVVMAPPNEASKPDADQVRALQIPAGCGLQLHVGTWHEFPFTLGTSLDLLVILRHETNRDLQQIEDGEAIGEDLEKRNIERRLGIRFVFDVRPGGETTGTATGA